MINNCTPQGTDGSSPFDRMSRYGTWTGTAGENLMFGGARVKTPPANGNAPRSHDSASHQTARHRLCRLP